MGPRVWQIQHGRPQEVIGDPAQSGELGTASTLFIENPFEDSDGLWLCFSNLSLRYICLSFWLYGSCVNKWFHIMDFPPTKMFSKGNREISPEFPIKIVFHLPGSLGSFFWWTVSRQERGEPRYPFSCLGNSEILLPSEWLVVDWSVV